MKKHLILFITVFVMLGFSSCDPDVEIPGIDHVNDYNMVYLPRASGEIQDHTYTIRVQAEPEEFLFRAVYGGLGYPSKAIEVTFQADPSLVEKYNVENGTTYPVLADDAFTLDDKAIINSDALLSSEIKLSVNSQALSMEPFTEYMVAVKIKEVSDNIAINEDLRVAYLTIMAEPNRIYMPLAEGGVKNHTISIKQEPEEFLFNAAYGGIGSPSKDIEVTFQTDTSLVEEYNIENGTNYPFLPADAFTLSDTKAKIPSDSLMSSNITLSVNSQASSMEPFTEYMLAVKIKEVSDNTLINEDLQVAHFIFKKEPNIDDYDQFVRTDWSVVDFSTEEPAEGANGGLVSSTFDGQDNTYWHSKWTDGGAPPPHWFIIDMGASHVMHGLSFLTRQSDNSGKPKEVEVEISMNGTDWTVAGDFTLENISDLQNQFFSSGFNMEARYFKVTVKSAYNADYTHLAEIYAF